MKSIFKNRSLLFLIFLTILGGVLRFWKLDSFPISLNWDEASHGYNAYSILKTSKDEWGHFMPLIFRAFGDFKLPTYIYLSVIPVWLFGLSTFAVRFISALAGTLAISGIYLLAKQLFPEKKRLPFLSALFLAISPWHFFISRPALEANLALTLIIFGFYFLIRFFHKSSSLLPAAILLGLSLHTYNTARVFVPLLLIISLFIFRTSLRGTKQSPTTDRIKNFLAVTTLCLSLSLVAIQFLSGEGAARYEKLKILSPSTVFQIGENRAKSKLPPLLAKVVYNRPVFFLTTFAHNYFSYFSPDFFSQKWGAQFQFAIPNKNLLTLPVFLLAFLGFFSFLPSLRSTPSFQFLYTWLLLSPIAASLTIDPPQALRPNPMIPTLIIMAVLGLLFLSQKISPKYTGSLLIVVILWIATSFSFYFYNYSTQYRLKYSSSWQYGYSQVMDYVQKHQSDYDRVIITKRYGEPHIFYGFFTGLDPHQFQPRSNNIRFAKSDWFWTDKIDNVYFVNDWQIPTISINSLSLESGEVIPTTRSLLITSPDHIPINAHVLQTINFLDGSPAFIITSVP